VDEMVASKHFINGINAVSPFIYEIKSQEAHTQHVRFFFYENNLDLSIISTLSKIIQFSFSKITVKGNHIRRIVYNGQGYDHIYRNKLSNIGVVTMNKKTLLIVCISLLLAIALFIIVKGLQTPQRLTIDSEQTTEEEQEDLHPDGEQDDSESEDQKFISALTEAIQSTISFFAHKETNIVAIGDSLTQGVGDSQKKGGYVGILERTINKEDQLAHFENYGKRGDRTDQLIDRLDSTEIQASIREADIILITI